MIEKRGKMVGFRPTSKNQERLEKAKKNGFETSDLLNGLIEKCFDQFVVDETRTKIARLQKSLAA